MKIDAKYVEKKKSTLMFYFNAYRGTTDGGKEELAEKFITQIIRDVKGRG